MAAERPKNGPKRKTHPAGRQLAAKATPYTGMKNKSEKELICDEPVRHA